MVQQATTKRWLLLLPDERTNQGTGKQAEASAAVTLVANRVAEVSIGAASRTAGLDLPGIAAADDNDDRHSDDDHHGVPG